MKEIHYKRLNDFDPGCKAALIYAKQQGYEPIAVEKKGPIYEYEARAVTDRRYNVYVKSPGNDDPGYLQIVLINANSIPVKAFHIYKNLYNIKWMRDEPVEEIMELDRHISILDPRDRC